MLLVQHNTHVHVHVHAVDLQLSMTFLGPWADSVRLTDSADTEDYIIHATCVCCQFANGRPVRLGSIALFTSTVDIMSLVTNASLRSNRLQWASLREMFGCSRDNK